MLSVKGGVQDVLGKQVRLNRTAYISLSRALETHVYQFGFTDILSLAL